MLPTVISLAASELIRPDSRGLLIRSKPFWANKLGLLLSLGKSNNKTSQPAFAA